MRWPWQPRYDCASCKDTGMEPEVVGKKMVVMPRPCRFCPLGEQCAAHLARTVQQMGVGGLPGADAQVQMGGEPPVKSPNLAVVFLYGLLRDLVHPGDMEQKVLEIEGSTGKTHSMSNGYLAGYAENIAARLRLLPPGTERVSPSPGDGTYEVKVNLTLRAPSATAANRRIEAVLDDAFPATDASVGMVRWESTEVPAGEGGS